MEKSGYVIGIDIGGTNFRIVRYGLRDGQFGVTMSVKVMQWLPSLKDAIAQFVSRDTTSKTVGIGIGVAASWDSNGVIDHCPNSKWLEGVALFAEIEDRFGIPVVGGNDLDVIARGVLPTCDPNEVELLFNWGTGINTRIIYAGTFLGRAEAGHIVVFPEQNYQAICGCGRMNCWEAHAGSHAIRDGVSRALELMAQKDRERVLSYGDTPYDQLRVAFSKDEEWTEPILGRALDACAEGLSIIHRVASPFSQMIVTGTMGVRTLEYDKAAERLRNRMADLSIVNREEVRGMPFVIAPSDAGAKGAALMAADVLRAA